MTSTASTLEIEEFINGVLVSWLESCLPHPEILTGYSALLDGMIIHSVWLQIDPEPQNIPKKIINNTGVSLCIARAKNFECIIRNLKTLFEEEFGQTILVLPDSFMLGYHPETKLGLEQMKLMLTLLLGAAVQCPNKELFIGRIKELDVETQHAIVELIKQVTDNHSLVLTEESVELLGPATMYNHILRLTKERDNMYSKWITCICMEQETLQGCTDSNTCMSLPTSGTTSTPLPSSSSNSETNHMAVELADLKSKLRKLRQELEEKAEGQLELREELEYKNTQYDKLRNDSQEWYAEAKRAAAYRDEVDVLRERAERAERLEIEVQKFREKLTDAEFYKTRVEELREDNRMLLETKEMLEDQLQRSRKRGEHVMALESEIIKYKQKLNDMALERDVDRSKLEELLEENTQLQLVAKNLNVTQEADKSFSDNDDDCNSGDNSLSEQLTNSAQTRALKLELENRRLLAALDQLKESSFHESTNKILELEKDKKKLSLKTEQMQENIQRLLQQNVELENVFKNALEENIKLQDSLDSRQKSYDRQSQEREVDRSKLIDLEKQVETLHKEKQRIQTLNESIQRRADDMERLLDLRANEIEQLTSRTELYDATADKLYDLETRIASYDRENLSLLKEVEKLKENLEGKAVQLDEKVSELNFQKKEVNRLTKLQDNVDKMQQRICELEKHNQDLSSQRDIDMETIVTLRNDLVTGTIATNKVKHNLEKLGLAVEQSEDNAELNVKRVVENLVRNPETFKTVREIMLNVFREKTDLQTNAKSDICVLCHRKEVFTVERNIEISREPREHSIEHKLILSTPRDSVELARLYEANTQLGASNTALQSSNDQQQAEIARLTVDVATLGSQITSLNTQHVALQLANSQLAADKDLLLKKLESVKQDHKNLLHDQTTLQCLHDQLATEYEALNKGKEQLKTIVRDLRNESRDLREHITSLEKQIEDLKKQNSSMKSCAEDLTILRTEHSKLTDDFRNLFATSDRFKNEYKNIQEQYKMIRMENSKLKLQNTELSGEMNARSDQVKFLEMEYTKEAHRNEMLLQMNSDLDTDRKTLMENVSQLLSQYHELLAHSLEDKQHFHNEEKSYAERVHNLSRQKEKLEEKIMEHYKKSESTVHKKKPFVSNLVRRVKKASSGLMNPSRNRRSWVDDSRLTQSQFMIGSESGGNDSDNSVEEPTSVASDTQLLQRNIPMRQSIQRRLEAADVTGSSLTLGTAGSRRTVYLIDENQKMPETNQSIDSSTTNNLSATDGDANSAEPQTPKNASQQNTDNPSTFLMYNRINTMIGGNASNTVLEASELSTNVSSSGNNRDSIPTAAPKSDDEKTSRKPRAEDKSNSIWYEYGCV